MTLNLPFTILNRSDVIKGCDWVLHEPGLELRPCTKYEILLFQEVKRLEERLNYIGSLQIGGKTVESLCAELLRTNAKK